MNKPILSVFLIFILIAALLLAHWLDGQAVPGIDPNPKAPSIAVTETEPAAPASQETTLPPQEESAETAPQSSMAETTVFTEAAIETAPAVTDAAAETTLSQETQPVLSSEPAVSGGEKAVTLSNIEIPELRSKGVLRLCQQDARWSQERYSRNTMAGGGCGPVSLSRALTYATGEEIMPLDLIDMKDPYGRVYRYASTMGTECILIPGWAAQFGVEAYIIQNPNVVRYEMERRNAIAIAMVTGGSLTDEGHYVVVTEIHDDHCLILDPTLEGINRFPDGIVSNASITAHSSNFVLFYPKDTEHPEEKVLQERSKNVSFMPSEYAKVAEQLDQEEQA